MALHGRSQYLDGSVSYDLPEETASLRPGPGVEVARNNCMSCHSADDIALQPPNKGGAFREAELNKMIKTYKAPIDEADVKTITEALAKTSWTSPAGARTGLGVGVTWDGNDPRSMSARWLTMRSIACSQPTRRVKRSVQGAHPMRRANDTAAKPPEGEIFHQEWAYDPRDRTASRCDEPDSVTSCRA
jgi:hypothetical protein